MQDQGFINSIHNLGNPGRLNRIFLFVLDWSLQLSWRQFQFFGHLSSPFNLSRITKVNYGLIKSKVQIKKSNATRCKTKIAILVLLWKFQHFRRPIYDPVEHQWWNFYPKIGSHWVYSEKISIIGACLDSKYASAYWRLFKRFITLKCFTL